MQSAQLKTSVVRRNNGRTETIETMDKLKLSKLHHILKAHYKQKSATELYQELTVVCQVAKESDEDFLIRALDL